MRLLREVAVYREGKGQFRWNKEWFTLEAAQGWIESGQLVSARQDGELVGVMLFQSEDQRFWPDRPKGEAFFVHRLARKPGARIEGGLAGPMLDWAYAETKRLGRPWLRLDCAPDDKLCAIYEGWGFDRIDLKQIEPDFWSWRWEKSSGT